MMDRSSRNVTVILLSSFSAWKFHQQCSGGHMVDLCYLSWFILLYNVAAVWRHYIANGQLYMHIFIIWCHVIALGPQGALGSVLYSPGSTYIKVTCRFTTVLGHQCRAAPPSVFRGTFWVPVNWWRDFLCLCFLFGASCRAPNAYSLRCPVPQISHVSVLCWLY